VLDKLEDTHTHTHTDSQHFWFE